MNDDRNAAVGLPARGWRRSARRNRSPSPHRRMRRSSGLRHVLEREVEVGHARGADGVDQRVGELGGIEVEQPDPVDRARPRPRPAGRWRRALARVPAVGRPGPGPRARPRGTPQRPSTSARIDVDRPATLRAPERRDGAEAAGPVAALGHLDVGPRRAARRPGQVRAGRRRDRRSTRRRRPRVTGTPKPTTASTSGRAAASSAP